MAKGSSTSVSRNLKKIPLSIKKKNEDMPRLWPCLKVFGICLSDLGGQLMKRDILGLDQHETKTAIGRWVSIAWSGRQ